MSSTLNLVSSQNKHLLLIILNFMFLRANLIGHKCCIVSIGYDNFLLDYVRNICD